jgi:hypothetical protein
MHYYVTWQPEGEPVHLTRIAARGRVLTVDQVMEEALAIECFEPPVRYEIHSLILAPHADVIV